MTHSLDTAPLPLHPRFPRFREKSSRVPAWIVSLDHSACIHRFFDTPAISPSGRYLALFQLPYEDRMPQPGEEGRIVLIDLVGGQERVIAETSGWEPQLGANINWGGSDEELFFNDVDTQNWHAFAWKLNPFSGVKTRLSGTVYHASPDGRWLISSDLRRTRRTQPGYGVCIPDETVPHHSGAVDDDGFFLTDTQSGERRLLLSIRDLLDRANPAMQMDDPGQYEFVPFHSKFNPQSDRLMLSLRWYPKTREGAFYMFKQAPDTVRFAWFTCRPDGSELACAIGPEHWEHGGHHATWFPDGEHISMNLGRPKQDGLKLVQVRYDGSNLRNIVEQVPGSGHPTVAARSDHIVADTYDTEALATPEGEAPLRWINRHTQREEHLLYIPCRQPHAERTLRVDPHPAWDRSGRYLVCNSYLEGTRRVLLVDMKSVLSE